MAELEGTMKALLVWKPELKKAEELLEKFKELKTPEDIKRTVSEELEATKIPEMIDTKIEKGIKKELSAVDEMVTTLVTRKLAEADKQSGKLIGDPSDYVILGEAEYLGGHYKRAIEQYDKAIKLKPEHVRAWLGKGYALHELGRVEEALKAWDKAKELRSQK